MSVVSTDWAFKLAHFTPCCWGVAEPQRGCPCCTHLLNCCLQVYQRDFTDAKLEAQPTTPGMKYRHYSPTAPLLLVDPTQAWQMQQQEQQQQQHSSVQQLVVQATEQLLQDLRQQQQQQPQRVVLLSTCSSHGSQACGAVGWTTASMQALQHQQQNGHHGEQQPLMQQQQQGAKQHMPDCTPSQATDVSSCSSGGLEVLEYVLGSWQRPEVVAQQVFAALRAADAVRPALIIAQGLPPEGAALAVMNRLHKAASKHVAVTGC